MTQTRRARYWHRQPWRRRCWTPGRLPDKCALREAGRAAAGGLLVGLKLARAALDVGIRLLERARAARREQRGLRRIEIR